MKPLYGLKKLRRAVVEPLGHLDVGEVDGLRDHKPKLELAKDLWTKADTDRLRN